MNGLAAALVATTAAQAFATLSVFILPVLAPTAAAGLGVPAHLVGYQVALLYTAASATSLGVGWLLARMGPARATQLALLACGLGAVLIALGGIPGVVIGSLAIGFGYGLTNPAATQVLTRLAPPARRNLVFSVKQMGVPFGGALAGLLLPSLALLAGWRGAALVVAALLLAAAGALAPFRAAWDATRPEAPGTPRLGTAAALRAGRGLPGLAAMGATFSAMQLSLGAYAVTMLVDEFGWTPVAAGAAAAAIHASGAGARLAWAVLADRHRAGLAVLAAIGTGTGLSALGMPFALHWPELAVLALLCLFGACSAGWTGVAMAEVARLAPPGAAGAATGGVLAVTYTGVVVGPLVFASMVTAFGAYSLAFAAMAALPLAGAAIAWRTRRVAR